MTNKDPSTASGNLTSTEDKAVEVDGFLGRQLPEFSLHWLLPSQLGNDRFSEVYVDTESGNRYAIMEERYVYPETEAPLRTFIIINGRDIVNRPRGDKSLPVRRLTQKDMDSVDLRVGEPLDFSGGHSTKILSITAVNSSKHYLPGHLRQMTGGESSDVRSEFWGLAGLQPPHGNLMVRR